MTKAKPANAPKTTATPAAKAAAKPAAAAPETPATSAEPEKVAEPDPAAAAAAAAAAEQVTETQGKPAAGDAIGKDPDPAAGGEPGGDFFTPEEIDGIKREAYASGFSDALDDQGDNEAPTFTGEQQDPEPGQGASYAGEYDLDTNRIAIIALAMMVPESQRKGGMTYLVDRLQAYIDGLPATRQYPAVVFMRTIAEQRPVDLASGAFENLVNEGLSALYGDGPDTSHHREQFSQEAAAGRLESQAMPEDVEVDADPELGEEIDPTDANAGSSAARRLAGAL